MFRLAAFGGLSLVDRVASDVAMPRRRLAMLALLARAGTRGLTREKLIAYLWPESSSDDARHSLEQLLYSLRRQLGAGVVVGSDPLRLNADVISSDVAAFEDALARGADDEAVATYRGSFLDGFYLRNADEFERWVEAERSRMNTALVAALQRLADKAAERGDWLGAVAAWRALVALDRLSARNAMGLLRALAAAGDRPEALRTAAEYELLVEQELGIPVEQSIATFVQTLRRGNPGVSAAPADAERTLISTTERQDFTPPFAPHAPVQSPGALVSPTFPLSRFRRPLFVTALLVPCVAILFSILWLASAVRSRPTETPAPGRQNVVVMAFENRTRDSAQDILGIMIADYTRIALQRTGLLDVGDPAFDLWRLENARPANRANLATLLQQTHATIIVRGAFYREGDSLSFTGEGIDTKTGRLIFAFDSVNAGVLERRDAAERVRQHVMSALATHVDPALTPWAGHEGTPPIRFDAYQAFADGMTNFVNAIAEQGKDRQSAARFFGTARAHLERAFLLDSTYYVAALWWFWSRYNVGDRPGADSVLGALSPRRAFMSPYERVLFDYNYALMHGTPEQRFQLDKQLVKFAPASEFRFCLARDALESNHPREALEVLTTLDGYSWVRLMRPPSGLRVRAFVEQGEYKRAVNEARRIHDSAPDDLAPAYPEVDALAALGRLDEIEAVVNRFRGRDGATEVNSANLMLYAGLRLQSAGRAERAKILFARALAAYSDGRASNVAADALLLGRARSLYYLEQWDKARVAFEQLANAPLGSRYDRRVLVFLGSLAARRDDATEVFRIRQLLQSSSINPAVARYFEARVAAVRGDNVNALRLLSDAVSRGVQAEELVMEGDAAASMEPDFAALRGSVAFRTALGRW